LSFDFCLTLSLIDLSEFDFFIQICLKEVPVVINGHAPGHAWSKEIAICTI